MENIRIINWEAPGFQLNPKMNEDNIVEKLIHSEVVKKAFLEYAEQRRKDEIKKKQTMLCAE